MGTKQNIPLFIERKEELESLQRALQEVVSSKKLKIIFINGDSGIGKTALVDTFIDSIDRTSFSDQPVVIARADCFAGQNSLVPFSDLLLYLEKNEPLAQRILGASLFLLKEIAPVWADLVTAGKATQIKDAVEKSISQLEETKIYQSEVFHQYARIIEKILQKNTLVIFLDDIQWADQSSLALITYLSKRLSKQPVLFLAAYHKEDITDVFGKEEYRKFVNFISNLLKNCADPINLEKGITTWKYINARYPQNNFPATVIEKIDAISEGHPHLLKELFNEWERKNVLVEEEFQGRKTWVLKMNENLYESSLDIPSKITKIIEDRLEFMEANLLEIVKNAAVEGNVFTAEVISEACSIELKNLFNSLRVLRQNYSLVRPVNEPDMDDSFLAFYTFMKSFYRDVIYKTIDPGDKRLLHSNLANSIEKIYSDNLDIVAARLAFHYKNVRDFEKAVQYSIRAAYFEQKNYGWLEAEKICREGLLLCKKLKEGEFRNTSTFQLLRISARCLYICGYIRLANTRFQEISELIPLLNLSVEDHLLFLFEFIDICEDLNRINEAQKYTRVAKDLIEQKHYSGKYIHQFTVYQSWVHIRAGENQKAIDMLEAVLAITADQKEFLGIMPDAYNALALAYSGIGDGETSQRYFIKAVDASHQVGEVKKEMVALLNLADDLLYYDRLPEAIVYNERALALVKRIGDRDSEAYALANKGRIELLSNRPENAVMYLNDSILIMDDIGSDWDKSFVYTDLAASHMLLKDQEKAFQCIELAADYLEKDPFRTAYMLRTKARILCEAGQAQQGIELYRKVMKLCIEMGDVYFHNETLELLNAELNRAKLS